MGKDVFTGVRNGELDFALTQTPKDLTFRRSGGWERNVIGRWNHGEWAPGSEPEGLPNGWYNGYAVGSGNPVLELSAASNGTLNLNVGEKTLDFNG